LINKALIYQRKESRFAVTYRIRLFISIFEAACSD